MDAPFVQLPKSLVLRCTLPVDGDSLVDPDLNAQLSERSIRAAEQTVADSYGSASVLFSLTYQGISEVNQLDDHVEIKTLVRAVLNDQPFTNPSVVQGLLSSHPGVA